MSLYSPSAQCAPQLASDRLPLPAGEGMRGRAGGPGGAGGEGGGGGGAEQQKTPPPPPPPPVPDASLDRSLPAGLPRPSLGSYRLHPWWRVLLPRGEGTQGLTGCAQFIVL